MNVVQYNYMYILITVNRMAVPKSKRTSCTNGSIPVRQRWRHVESKQERKKERKRTILQLIPTTMIPTHIYTWMSSLENWEGGL